MTNTPMTLQDWLVVISLISAVVGLIVIGMKGIYTKIDGVSAQNSVILNEVNTVKQRQAADKVRFDSLEKYIDDVDDLQRRVSKIEGKQETCHKSAS